MHASELSNEALLECAHVVAAMRQRLAEISDPSARLWLYQWCDAGAELGFELFKRLNEEEPAVVKGSIVRLENLANDDRDNPTP